jgi:hypothetical protein
MLVVHRTAVDAIPPCQSQLARAVASVLGSATDMWSKSFAPLNRIGKIADVVRAVLALAIL